MSPDQLRKRARTTIPALTFQAGLAGCAEPCSATAPGMKWVGDITHIPTWQGFAYLAVVMDYFLKKIIGHAIACHMRTGLIAQALTMAAPGLSANPWCQRSPRSARGAQHTSAEYTKCMTGNRILHSVGRTGSCFDDVAVESFNAILEKELVTRKVYLTRKHAARAVTAWTKLRGNLQRLHSAIGYQTSSEVDTELRQRHEAAA